MSARTLTALLTPMALVLALALLAAPSWAAPARIEICHVPPGNPDNVHTIIVSESALGAHLAHGDALGACPSGCQLDASLCDDNNLCTDDLCNDDGTCSHVDTTASCDDSNTCTLDTCDPGIGCVNTGLEGQECNDGDVCTIKAECTAAGQCEPIQQRPTCCRADEDCADGDLCTVNETCDVGTGECQAELLDCGGSDACTLNICVPSDGCVTTDTNCDDGNFCTDDSCDVASGCVNVPTDDHPATETNCGDGLDNDCDGSTDGDDADCGSDQCCESLCDDACTDLGGWNGDFNCGSAEDGPEVVCSCGTDGRTSALRVCAPG